MEEEKEVELRDGSYRVIAKELEYAMGAEGRLGQLWARGPGHVWGERDGRRFEARWRDEIRLRPYGENQVLSLKGDAQAEMAEMGRFSAEEVHVFFWEAPRADDPEKYELVPDRLKATGGVVVDSARFAARVREANLWFRTPQPTRSSSDQANAAPRESTRLFEKQERPLANEKTDRVVLLADLLHAQFRRGKTLQVERLNVQGGIEFQRFSAPGELPLVIRGDAFELEDAQSEHAQGTLVGRPASVSAQGMQMVGPQFLLQRRDNSLEIDGPGTATLPPRKTTGVRLPPFQISWEGGMRFDGRHAHFRQRVSTRGGHQLENLDVLDIAGSAETFVVTLNRYVDFNKPDTEQEMRIREFRFDENVKFESNLYDPSGERKLYQQMHVPNLTVNQQTERVTVDGPGWVQGVQPRKQLQMQTSADRWPTAKAGELDFIRVDFANRMTGLLGKRELEFGDHVNAIYGPVERWDETIDPFQPQTWSEDTFTLDCRQLRVADMGVTSDTLKNIVLEALDNAFVKGQTFSAQGQRISYTRIKDQLVLVGDGRNDAILSYQPHPNAAPAELKGGKILFWPNSGQFELNDVRSLDLRDLSHFQR
jgi:hypothetical protein